MPLTAIRDFTVTLRSNGKVVAETTLPADISISLMNVTQGHLDLSRANGLEVPGEPGDRVVLLIGAIDVDPFSSLSIVLSEPIDTGADPLQFFKITLDGQPITLKARVDSERRVVFESPASLKRGGKYRLEISPDLADKSGLRIGQVLDVFGNPTPKLVEPLYLDFEIREPHGSVGSFDLANGVIRDMALTNNVLLISAQEGGIVAYDEKTYGVVSLLGYGVAVIDLNAIESNDAAVKPAGYESVHDVESERVFGAKTEDTPAGWPRAHLRIPMQRVVPDTMTHLRFQRGYNTWVSPWIVTIADIRASEKWQWPSSTTAAQKAEQGCFHCERPPALKGKPEPEVFELYAAERLIFVHPSVSTFAGTTYEFLIEENRLELRAAVVPADTLRPREVQIAAQNPPVAEGALQETTFLYSGEIGTSGIDLDAGGRSGLNVMAHRTYLSRTVGGTAFGAGWDSVLFRRLRPLPNGNVEYRAGLGEVWLFKPGLMGYEPAKGCFSN